MIKMIEPVHTDQADDFDTDILGKPSGIQPEQRIWYLVLLSVQRQSI